MRSVERGICPIAEFIMNNSVIFHCACVKLPYFYFWSKSDGWNRQDDQPVTAKFRGDFSIFQDGGRHHIGFFKISNFNGRTRQEDRTASLCQISWQSDYRSNGCRDSAFFDFSKIAAVRHIGFGMVMSRPPGNGI